MQRFRAWAFALACSTLVGFGATPHTASAQSALVEKATGKPSRASSFERAGLEAAKGNDGSSSTRWGSTFTDGQWWQVDLGSATPVSQVKLAWEAAYASRYRISVSTDGTNFTNVADESAYGAGERTTSFTQRTARYVRVTSLTRGTRWGISFFELKVLGATAPPPAPSTTLVEKAAGRPAAASSSDWSEQRGAAAANDGNATTRWSSAYTDGQWWQVDLGATRPVSQVKVLWEAAYASRYRVSTSTDGSTWIPVAEETATSAGEKTTSFSVRDARFVRITGLTRATPYGISFFETKVLGPSESGTTTQPGPAPAPTASSTLLPPRSAPLSDADAASRVRRSSWEPRPENATANRRVPTASELSAYRAARGAGWCNGADLKVTGNFTGTTDEIIQWAAWKWGLEADMLRAVAVTESYWRQSALGDYVNGRAESYGLTQVRINHHGTYPLSQQSTAFNADYYGAIIRHYYDGCASWLNDVERVGTYAAGDIWGSVGAWFAGRWHTAPAEDYIATVKRHLAAKPWLQAGF